MEKVSIVGINEIGRTSNRNITSIYLHDIFFIKEGWLMGTIIAFYTRWWTPLGKCFVAFHILEFSIPLNFRIYSCSWWNTKFFGSRLYVSLIAFWQVVLESNTFVCHEFCNVFMSSNIFWYTWWTHHNLDGKYFLWN